MNKSAQRYFNSEQFCGLRSTSLSASLLPNHNAKSNRNHEKAPPLLLRGAFEVWDPA